MGGGKSYAAVEMALKAAREGALVHTNLPLEEDEWKALGLWEQVVILPRDPSRWIRFEKRIVDGEEVPVPCSDVITGGSEGRENLVVYDEASLVFRTKDQMKNRDVHQPVFDLVALSRHVGLEIHFIAQDEANVSVELRRLAQTTIKCVKAAEIPMIGAFAARLFGDFKRILYKGMSKTPWMATWHRFNPAIGRAYKTHGMAQSVAMRVDATRKTKGMDASAKKGILLFVVAPLICIGMLVWAFMRAKRDLYDAPKAKAAQEAKANPQPQGGQSAASPADSVAPPRKAGWKLKEWEAQDELIFAGAVKLPMGVRVYTRDGLSLSVGACYLGDKIVEYTPWAGWHYFETQGGRVVVVRPINAAERKELPPVTVQGQAPPTPAPQNVVLPAAAPIDAGLKAITNQIKGT